MDEKLSFRFAVRLFRGEKAFGPGMATLMRNVERTGSLQKASEEMGMTYSKAWRMIKDSERLWGFPLTSRYIGGKNGGGSRLTYEGRFLLERYEQFEFAVRETVQEKFCEYFSEDFFDDLGKAKADSLRRD